MCRFRSFLIISTAWCLISGPPAFAATISDDFEDGVIDAALWDTILGDASSGVTEAGGSLQLSSGGWLKTKAQFPTAGGPLLVAGRFKLGSNSEDRLAIVSRWDGVEQDVAFASHGSVPLHGLQIDLRPRTSPAPDPNGEAVFLIFDGDDGTFLGGNFDLLGSGLTLEAEGTYDFIFNDDGTNFSLTVTHVGGPGTGSATVGGSTSFSSGSDYVGIHNYSSVGGAPPFAALNLEEISVGDTIPGPLPSSGVPVAGVQTHPAKRIIFPGETGKDFQAQYCDDLPSNIWIDFGPVIAGDGGTGSVFDSTIDIDSRAFRVVELVELPTAPIAEDFEGYVAVNGTYEDITTLSSDWSRNDFGNGPDWEVACCSPGHAAADDTFDGSSSLLVLRRANDTVPDRAELNTDFTFSAMSDGLVSFELNPSGVGGSQNAFHAGFHDSSTGADAVRIRFYEFTNNDGDFEVTDEGGTVLATGTVPDDPTSFNRWFRVTFRIRDNGTFDVRCDDIGGIGGDPGRGTELNLEGVTLPIGVSSVDTLRLLPDASSGGSIGNQPTTIDNIGAGSVLASLGDPIGGVECEEAREITFPSIAGKPYQAQYSEAGDTNWVDVGEQITGSGGIDSAFDVAVAGRQWRVLDLQPTGFHGGFVNRTVAMFPAAPNGLNNITAGWGDVDNDGFPDLGDGKMIWKNNGGVSFTQLAAVPAKIFADVNNDGFLDAYGYQNNSPTIMDVYRNNSGASFTPLGFPVLDARNDNRGTCWGDWDKDGDPDLYIAAFEFNLTPPHGAMNWPDHLVRNDGGTSFVVNWTEPPTPLRSRGVTACDFDHDQDLDIFVCHYRLQANYLFVNSGAGTFANQAAALRADGFQAGHPVSPFAHTIGAAWGDMDNDGDFDLFVANFAHPQGWNGIPTNQPESQFLENQGSAGGYQFVDRASTVQLEYQESIAAPALADYDNDGDLDFWVGTAIESGSVGDESPVLYRNEGNWNFTDVTAEAGFGNLGISYQSAWADADDDGDLDLVTNGKIFINQGSGNHWLKVKVDGINQANVGRDAIGTQVKIDLGGGNILVRQVESGTGEHCSNDLVLHFGLGLSTNDVDLEVTWLNGNTQTVQDVAVDQTVAVQ